MNLRLSLLRATPVLRLRLRREARTPLSRKADDEAVARLAKMLSDPQRVYIIRSALAAGEVTPTGWRQKASGR